MTHIAIGCSASRMLSTATHFICFFFGHFANIFIFSISSLVQFISCSYFVRFLPFPLLCDWVAVVSINTDTYTKCVDPNHFFQPGNIHLYTRRVFRLMRACEPILYTSHTSFSYPYIFYREFIKGIWICRLRVSRVESMTCQCAVYAFLSECFAYVRICKWNFVYSSKWKYNIKNVYLHLS